MSRARVAVVQFPGVNCEAESARALERIGLTAEVFRWTRKASELRDYQAFVLPGGFSYQDRVRGGALASKDPMVEVLAEEAERGKPLLGICNGAQVLVESGLVPVGLAVELALARNRMPERSGYYARWIYARVEDSPCVFTRAIPAGTLIPLPVAHGEGRFTAREPERVAALVRAGLAPLRYAASDGTEATRFPDNPNGSEEAVAAVCNARGNVLAMMPHPERAQDLGQVSRAMVGEWAVKREQACDQDEGEPESLGPGMLFFESLRQHLTEA